jgi:hypothetical protein
LLLGLLLLLLLVAPTTAEDDVSSKPKPTSFKQVTNDVRRMVSGVNAFRTASGGRKLDVKTTTMPCVAGAVLKHVNAKRNEAKLPPLAMGVIQHLNQATDEAGILWTVCFSATFAGGGASTGIKGVVQEMAGAGTRLTVQSFSPPELALIDSFQPSVAGSAPVVAPADGVAEEGSLVLPAKKAQVATFAFHCTMPIQGQEKPASALEKKANDELPSSVDPSPSSVFESSPDSDDVSVEKADPLNLQKEGAKRKRRKKEKRKPEEKTTAAKDAKNPAKDATPTPTAAASRPLPLPASYDVREAFPACKTQVSTPKKQGSCGSCYAFAATGMAGDRHCIAASKESTGKKSMKGKSFSLSEQDLLSCGSRKEGKRCVPVGPDDWTYTRYAGGCDGHSTLLSLAYGADHGYVRDSCAGGYKFNGDSVNHFDTADTSGEDDADDENSKCLISTKKALTDCKRFTELNGNSYFTMNDLVPGGPEVPLLRGLSSKLSCLPFN